MCSVPRRAHGTFRCVAMQLSRSLTIIWVPLAFTFLYYSGYYIVLSFHYHVSIFLLNCELVKSRELLSTEMCSFKIHFLKPGAPEPQNGAVFGARALEEVSKLK